MAQSICPECVAGKHGNCNGQAWDMEKDEPTACECGHSIGQVMAEIDEAERGFRKIEGRGWSWESKEPGLVTIEHHQEQEIKDLLLGRRVVAVDDDHLMLDNGAVVKVVPNEGGCLCGAGDYDLTALQRVDNVITNVVLDYHPDDDWSYGKETEHGKCLHGGTEGGHYRIFVLAGDEKINLMSAEGSDGNGYYGTGYSLVVRPPTVQGQVVAERRALDAEPTVGELRASGLLDG